MPSIKKEEKPSKKDTRKDENDEKNHTNEKHKLIMIR